MDINRRNFLAGSAAIVAVLGIGIKTYPRFVAGEKIFVGDILALGTDGKTLSPALPSSPNIFSIAMSNHVAGDNLDDDIRIFQKLIDEIEQKENLKLVAGEMK